MEGVKGNRNVSSVSLRGREDVGDGAGPFSLREKKKKGGRGTLALPPSASEAIF